MSKGKEVLYTLTAAAIEFALDNVEQFKLHMEAMATEKSEPELAAAVPDTDNLSTGLALAGLMACHAAEQASRPSLADLLGGGIGVTVMGPYAPDELNGELPPELAELLTAEPPTEEAEQS